MKTRILLVDDDAQALESTRKILEFADFEVVIASDGQAALELLQKSRLPEQAAGVAGGGFDLVLSDVRMPRLTGLEFLKAVSLSGRSVPVILMTAFGRVEEAVWAMKYGAVDFLTKPFKRQALLEAVDLALSRARGRGLRAPESAVSGGAPVAEGVAPSASSDPLRILLGQSPAMQSLRRMITQVAPTTATVLIQGESGTGKERVAQLIHELSARKNRPFVAINCAALPDQLLESELFGYEKGAFTGATQSKMGLFEAASGGTLLLDEIGDLPLPLQAKLLRVIQEGEVRRLGASASRKVDVRLVSATHRDLKKLAASGQFRQDLLFRLEVVTLSLAPLRERKEDLPEFARAFLIQANERHGKSVQGFSRDAIRVLTAHAWPGNVRELQNVIERAVIFAHGAEIAAADLPSHLIELTLSASANPGSVLTVSVPVGTPLKDVEELMIRKTLELTQGDKNITAKLLGINSRTIYRKLKEDGGKDEGREDEPSV